MKMWVWLVVIVLVLGGAYFYRGQLMSMFSGGYSSPVSYAPSYTAPTGGTASGDVVTWVNGTNLQYAVGANQLTLYTFDKDTKGVSNCTGSCAGVWPPYTTTSTPSTLPSNVTLIKRTDGSMQFAYKGMPVYYYSGDKAVGDVTGDGFNGIWHIVKP